ncbi:MAG: hypothetical protein LIO87_06150 [Eubacterium sp.]|nr:hypothetical protein [Eubacterium sp.]
MEGYEFYIGSLKFVVDFGGVILAAVVSAVLTMLTMSLLFIRRVAKEASIILTGAAQMKTVMEKCRRLFPIDVVEYHGTTFKRGMAVKITLSDRKSFVGCFVGRNYDNMVCVVTPKSIIAQEIGLIVDLTPADESYTDDE